MQVNVGGAGDVVWDEQTFRNSVVCVQSVRCSGSASNAGTKLKANERVLCHTSLCPCDLQADLDLLYA